MDSNPKLTPKKLVLREDLKILRDSAFLISEGREFHNFGTRQENAILPMDLKRVAGTVSRPASVVRRLRAVVWGTKRFDRY